MDISRLRQGEQIAGVSAILLFVFMFFDWFGVKVSGGGVSVESAGGGNAWDALDFIPFILIIAIIAVLAMVVVRANSAEVNAPVSSSVIATALAALGALLILYRIINPPDIAESFGGVDVDVTRKFGLYISFIAAAAMTYGGWRAMEEEGTSFGTPPTVSEGAPVVGTSVVAVPELLGGGAVLSRPPLPRRRLHLRRPRGGAPPSA